MNHEQLQELEHQLAAFQFDNKKSSQNIRAFIESLLTAQTTEMIEKLGKIHQEAIPGERLKLIKEFTEEAVVMTPMDASDLADTEEDSKPFVYLDDAIDLLTPESK